MERKSTLVLAGKNEKLVDELAALASGFTHIVTAYSADDASEVLGSIFLEPQGVKVIIPLRFERFGVIKQLKDRESVMLIKMAQEQGVLPENVLVYHSDASGSALPDQMRHAFPGIRVLDTGNEEKQILEFIRTE